jgi:hypothetical protein
VWGVRQDQPLVTRDVTSLFADSVHNHGEAGQMMRKAYVDAAATAALLLRDPAVGASWAAPSALEKWSVGGLAGHLARQIVHLPYELDQPVPDGRPISLLDHFARSQWAVGDIEDAANTGIRHRGDREAADGAGVLIARTDDVLAELRSRLPSEAHDRLVHLPGGPWSLSLDDFLTTRLLEIVVHCDDLAVSVGVGTPPLPQQAVDVVLGLLCQLASRRHGPIALLRALSRAERAPATIAAF